MPPTGTFLEQTFMRPSKTAGMEDDLLLTLPLHQNGVFRYFQMTCNSKLHTLNSIGYSLQGIRVMIPPSNVTVGCLTYPQVKHTLTSRISGGPNKQGAWKTPEDEISRGVGISEVEGSEVGLVVQRSA